VRTNPEADKIRHDRYHEDFFMINAFTREEELLLKDVVGCSLPLPTQPAYVQQIEDGGFTQVRPPHPLPPRCAWMIT
jgi:hypothetical protein